MCFLLTSSPVQAATMQLQVFVLAIILATASSNNGNDNTNRVTIDHNQQRVVDHAELVFKQLFRKRRAEQLDAVRRLLVLESYEKQFKMVNVIMEKVFSVIESSRVLLESSGYVPGVTIFPKEEKVLDALANILENTALFGDILLHLPDISQKIFTAKNEWKVLLQWSLGFVNETQLLDQQTRTLVDLVSMELNLTERHADYINPYRRLSASQRNIVDKIDKKQDNKKKGRRKEIKRGPRLSAGEL